MPKIVSSKEFRSKMRKHVSTLEDSGGYIVVANGKTIDGMFVAMTPDKFSDMADKAGLDNEKKGIDNVYNDVKEYISDRYRKMRMQR